MLPPQDSRSLLEQAAAGTLTTLADGMMMPILLSVQGQARLTSKTSIASLPDPLSGDRLCGSIRRSPDGSADGSREVLSEQAIFRTRMVKRPLVLRRHR
jgi:hypothetical protein